MKLKELLTKLDNAKIVIIPREKNKLFIDLIKASLDEIIDIIKNLTEKDFIKKTKDRDSRYGGDLWIFKKEIKGYMAYIKLKYRSKEDDIIIVISFHEDEK